MTLEEKLQGHHEADVYPFHMPGHKRQVSWLCEPYCYDITEIDGFDNLYEAKGILGQLQAKAAQLYGSSAAHVLVNGSTVGNLAAIFATTNPGDSIIISRHCHKSVYNACLLRQLRVSYVLPQLSDIGLIEATPLSEYERAIVENPTAKSIVVTSPTYEGIFEDLTAIAALAHKYGMYLIVDSAHGAHLGFTPSTRELAPVKSGADLVVMSLHKTLPALTQTALLHVCCGAEKLEEKVARYIEMFQTSSPSYLLMASVEKCLNFLENGQAEFEAYERRLEEFYQRAEGLKNIRLTISPTNHRDLGKLIIDTTGLEKVTGRQLKTILREQFNLELEMASFGYALAMTSVMDTEEGFERLLAALKCVDEEYAPREDVKNADAASANASGTDANPNLPVNLSSLYHTPLKSMDPYEASLAQHTKLRLADAQDKVCAVIVSIYPPAIPLVVPGEVFTEEKVKVIEEALRFGLDVTGVELADNEIFVQVIVEKKG